MVVHRGVSFGDGAKAARGSGRKGVRHSYRIAWQDGVLVFVARHCTCRYGSNFRVGTSTRWPTALDIEDAVRSRMQALGLPDAGRRTVRVGLTFDFLFPCGKAEPPEMPTECFVTRAAVSDFANRGSG